MNVLSVTHVSPLLDTEMVNYHMLPGEGSGEPQLCVQPGGTSERDRD